MVKTYERTLFPSFFLRFPCAGTSPFERPILEHSETFPCSRYVLCKEWGYEKGRPNDLLSVCVFQYRTIPSDIFQKQLL
jgi:hypothetical protein